MLLVFFCVSLFFSPGFFSPQHSAKHQLQDVCEEWELSHHAHEPQPVPALPLQEMPVCGHVERRWDIPTFNESFATVLWSAQRRKEKRSPKAAQPQYVGLCIKKTPLRKSFEVIMPVAHSLPHADSRPAPVFPLSVSAPPTLATWPFFSLWFLGVFLLPLAPSSHKTYLFAAPPSVCDPPCSLTSPPPPSDNDLWEEEPWSPQSYLSSRKTAANISIILGNGSRVSSIVTCTPRPSRCS